MIAPVLWATRRPSKRLLLVLLGDLPRVRWFDVCRQLPSAKLMRLLNNTGSLAVFTSGYWTMINGANSAQHDVKTTNIAKRTRIIWKQFKVVKDDSVEWRVRGAIDHSSLASR